MHEKRDKQNNKISILRRCKIFIYYFFRLGESILKGKFILYIKTCCRKDVVYKAFKGNLFAKGVFGLAKCPLYGMTDLEGLHCAVFLFLVVINSYVNFD